MKMFKFYSNKTALLIPISILLIIFFIFIINLVNLKYDQAKQLHNLYNGIKSSIVASKLVHNLQIERGLSSGYFISEGKLFDKKLLVHRKLTSKTINDFLKLTKSEMFHISSKTKEVLKEIDYITTIRRDIDDLNIAYQDIIKYYSTLNANLLLSVYNLMYKADDIVIRRKISSYFNFLQLKENAGIERALGTRIVVNHTLDMRSKQQYYKYVVQQKLYKKMFLHNASKEFIDYYTKKTSHISTYDVQKMRKSIMSLPVKDKLNINATFWFDSITTKINLLKDVENYLTKDILYNINQKLVANNTNIIITTLLTMLSIMLFFYMIFKIINIIKAETKLKDMIDKYIISSTTDTKGRITSVSSAFCEISGYSKDELIGKSHNIIRHPNMPRELFKQMWLTIQNKRIFTGVIQNLKKDKGNYWVKAHIEPILDSKGNIESYFAIRQNITDKIELEKAIEENKQKDKQLLQQSRLAQMGEMISMIAHQWRQPLATISSTSAGLLIKARKDKLDNNTAIQLSSDIMSYTKHLSNTIDDFREFFKTNNKKTQTTYRELVNSVSGIIETLLMDKNIKLIRDLDCDTKFYTHTNELKQVILNLIKNAEDALLDRDINDPFIRIYAYKTDDTYNLEISDNAGGIPEDIIDNIFDPYFSTKEQKDGTGLGLYMSKTIIQEHCHGILSVKNIKDGALFKISIKESKNDL